MHQRDGKIIEKRRQSERSGQSLANKVYTLKEQVVRGEVSNSLSGFVRHVVD